MGSCHEKSFSIKIRIDFCIVNELFIWAVFDEFFLSSLIPKPLDEPVSLENPGRILLDLICALMDFLFRGIFEIYLWF